MESSTMLTTTRVIALVLVGAMVLPLAGCVTNAATGRSQFDSMSREEEIALGAEAGPQLAQEYGGVYADPAVQAYVAEVGMKLARHTEADYPSLPWEFTLLDSDVINAFSLPGGKVYISRGLASKFENEAELAGVLGHEIGHVVAEHVDKRVSAQTGWALGAAVAGAVAGQSGSGLIAQAVPMIVSQTGQGFLLKWGRDEEHESDELGVRYMVRAGYDPRGQIEVMKILRDSMEGGGRPPEWLSTHPYPENRIANLEAHLEKHYARYLSNPEYGEYAERFRERFLSKLK
jgi:predicted Zn-dependent protease